MSAADCRCCHSVQPCECCALHRDEVRAGASVTAQQTDLARAAEDQLLAEGRRYREQLARLYDVTREQAEALRAALAEARAEP